MIQVFNGSQSISFNDQESFDNFCSQYRIIEAAGGLVENANGEFLVIDRRGYIDLPKGKKEQGESNEQNALREVNEETGLEGLSIVGSLPNTYHIYPINGQDVLKCTHWYKMKVDGCPSLTPQTEEDILEAQWVSKEQLMTLAERTYASLKDVFVTAAKQQE